VVDRERETFGWLLWCWQALRPSDVAALFRSAHGLEGQRSHTIWEVKKKRNNELEMPLNDDITSQYSFRSDQNLNIGTDESQMQR